MAQSKANKRLDQVESDISEIKKLLTNHLHHHEMWMKYYFPGLLALANTALGYYLKTH